MGPNGPPGPDGESGRRGVNGFDGVNYITREGVKVMTSRQCGLQEKAARVSQ